MTDFVKKYGRNSILISVLLIILSLFLIFSPNTSLNVIMIAIGLILTVNGVFHTIAYFTGPKELKMFSFELTEGVLSLIIGIIFVFNPGIINTFLSLIIGAWIILKSITSIQLSLNIRSSTNNWILMLIVSIVTLILGIVMLFNPFATSILVTACGIMLFIFETINIIETVSMMRFIR